MNPVSGTAVHRLPKLAAFTMALCFALTTLAAIVPTASASGYSNCVVGNWGHEYDGSVVVECTFTCYEGNTVGISGSGALYDDGVAGMDVSATCQAGDASASCSAYDPGTTYDQYGNHPVFTCKADSRDHCVAPSLLGGPPCGYATTTSTGYCRGHFYGTEGVNKAMGANCYSTTPSYSGGGGVGSGGKFRTNIVTPEIP